VIVQHTQKILDSYTQSQLCLDVHEILTQGVNMFPHRGNFKNFYQVPKSKVILPPNFSGSLDNSEKHVQKSSFTSKILQVYNLHDTTYKIQKKKNPCIV